MLLEPFQIKNVKFDNRMLRSSMGGRNSYYDGTVSPAWVHFEKRFAHHGVAGIISPTISVNEMRQSPLEYPSLHDDDEIKDALEAHVAADLRAGSAEIKLAGNREYRGRINGIREFSDFLSM